jgi:hypothetical protein
MSRQAVFGSRVTSAWAGAPSVAKWGRVGEGTNGRHPRPGMNSRATRAASDESDFKNLLRPWMCFASKQSLPEAGQRLLLQSIVNLHQSTYDRIPGWFVLLQNTLLEQAGKTSPAVGKSLFCCCKATFASSWAAKGDEFRTNPGLKSDSSDAALVAREFIPGRGWLPWRLSVKRGWAVREAAEGHGASSYTHSLAYCV